MFTTSYCVAADAPLATTSNPIPRVDNATQRLMTRRRSPPGADRLGRRTALPSSQTSPLLFLCFGSVRSIELLEVALDDASHELFRVDAFSCGACFEASD